MHAEPASPGVGGRGVIRAGLAAGALALVALAVAASPGMAAARAAGTSGDGPPAGERVPEPAPEQVEEAPGRAEEVLSRDEFQEPDRSPIERAIDWIGDRLDDVFGAGTSGSVPSFTAWLVLIPLAALVVWLAVRAGRTVTRDKAEGGAEVQVESARGARDWLEVAADLEAEGRWKEGLRARYRALAARLVELRVIDELAGRTTGEHRVEVARAAPAAATAFAGAAELFDRAWYGDLPTGPDESRRFQELADETLATAARHARRPVDDLEPVGAP